jgi:hypothetical protein
MKHHMATIMFLSLMTHAHLRSADRRGHEPGWDELRADFDKPAPYRSGRSSRAGQAYPSSSRVMKPFQ